MKLVKRFFIKAFSNELSNKGLELKNDREYVIHFATTLKKAREDIHITDYSVSKEEQLTSKSCGLVKASR